jgi:hypothetical protein
MGLNPTSKYILGVLEVVVVLANQVLEVDMPKVMLL